MMLKARDYISTILAIWECDIKYWYDMAGGQHRSYTITPILLGRAEYLHFAQYIVWWYKDPAWLPFTNEQKFVD